jgi:hypothetical protein
MRTALGFAFLAVLAAFAPGAAVPQSMELLDNHPGEPRPKVPCGGVFTIADSSHAPVALADSSLGREGSDLGGGVLIAHHPPGLLYTVGSTDWCAAYPQIASCEALNPRIDDRSNPVVWYVLAAWHESDKVWYGTEFGLGDYVPSSLSWIDYGTCPGNAMTIPYGAWPGPNTGISIATTQPWTGNFRPVYFFTCYAYQSQTLPLTVHPKTGFAGFVNRGMTSNAYDAVCLGTMGLLTPGTNCCPPTVVAKVCCLVETCRITIEQECADLGGKWHPEWGTCRDAPCRNRLRHACCVDGVCRLIRRSVCECANGEWHPEWDSCAPDSCAR